MLTAASLLQLLTYLLIASSFTMALPSSAPLPANLAVLLRTTDSSYNHSTAMAAQILSTPSLYNLPPTTLEKRSYVKVQACYTSGCENCHVVWDGTFTSNSACLAADNTACLIISNMDKANVEFWNHAGCNGRHTIFSGCGEGDTKRSAPGTNSIGVHVNC